MRQALPRFHTIVVGFLATLTLIGLAHSLPQDASPEAGQPEVQSSPTGTVIEGTVNPYGYYPKNTEGHTDVDLRGIFEELGPVAIEWYQHVLTLSNPFFEGRVPASRGSMLAGEYVEFYFKQAGLRQRKIQVT